MSLHETCGWLLDEEGEGKARVLRVVEGEEVEGMGEGMGVKVGRRRLARRLGEARGWVQ